MNIETRMGSDTISLQLPFNVSGDGIDDNELQEIIADYLKKDHMFDPKTETILKCLYILLILSGILTNIVIISVIVSNKKLLTTSNLLLINLFVSDLLLCIFCMPFTLIAIIRRSWSFGAFLCKFVPFIQAVTTFVSAATISSIALDRMVQITSNHFSGQRRSLNHISLSSPKLAKYGYNTLIIWLIALLLASPICVYQKVVAFGIEGFVAYDKCMEMWPNNNRGIYSFVVLITQLLIPSSVMLISHYRIRAYLNSHRVRRIRRYIADRLQDSSSSFTNNEDNRRDSNVTEVPINISNAIMTCFPSPICDPNFYDKELHRNNKITIFLLTITIIFGVSWLPWNLFNVYVDFYPDINLSPSDLYLILAACHLVAMSSATTNAIFYGFLHTAIRRELTNIISKIKQYL